MRDYGAKTIADLKEPCYILSEQFAIEKHDATQKANRGVMAKILLVDDEASIVSVLSSLFKIEGHEVTSTLSGEEARDFIGKEPFDLLLSDISMTPVNGMELLRLAHDKAPSMPVIMLTAFATIETAIESLKLGAYDYITKPFKVDELQETVQRALQQGKAVAENTGDKTRPGVRYRLESLVAESPAMLAVCETIKQVASTNAIVLIQGESGTGKKLVAKTIHDCGHRKEHPFLSVHCADLSESQLETDLFGAVKDSATGADADKKGLLEAAEGGTIFIEEIGAMPQAVQDRFLRVLQDKKARRAGSDTDMPVNVRFIVASNANLKALVGEGRFREDLFIRLNVLPIAIAPLRERPEDVLPLARHFLQTEALSDKRPCALSPEAAAMLESYAWPGNVRELETAIRHGVASARDNIIVRESLPPEIAATPVAPSAAHAGAKSETADPEKAKSLKAFLHSKKKEQLQQVLALFGGDREKAAQSLKISPAALSRILSDSAGEAE